MTITSDFAGGWEFHGIITPEFMNWKRFESTTTSGNSLIRLTFYGNKSQVKSYGYIRTIFDTGELVESNWRRFYFSGRSIILDLNLPEEILINSQAVPRFYEIKKEFFRNYRRFTGLVTDEQWRVGLEVLESAALPTNITNALQGSPLKTFNIGNSGNIIVVIEGQQE